MRQQFIYRCLVCVGASRLNKRKNLISSNRAFHFGYEIFKQFKENSALSAVIYKNNIQRVSCSKYLYFQLT